MTSKFKEFLNTILKINNIIIFDTDTNTDNYIEKKSASIQWLFYSGMLFGSSSKWWGDMNKRQTEHEGIDIAFYIHNADIEQFRHNIEVPAIDNGVVLNICDDFLGKSIIIEHSWSNKVKINCQEQFESQLRADFKYSPEQFESQLRADFKYSVKDNFKIITIYSHLSLKNYLKSGMFIEKDEILGNIADTSMRKSKIPPHIHISVAAISTQLPLNELNWNLFGNPSNIYDKFIFINPLWL